MKKIMKLALCFLMIFSMCACSSSKKEETTKKHKKKISATAVEKVLRPYKVKITYYDLEENQAYLEIEQEDNFFLMDYNPANIIDTKINHVLYNKTERPNDYCTIYDEAMRDEDLTFNQYQKKYGRKLEEKTVLKEFKSFLKKNDLTYEELYMWLASTAQENNED